MVSGKEIALWVLLVPVILYCLRMMSMMQHLSFKRKDPVLSSRLPSSLSVLIPFYNEEKNLPELLSCLEKQMNIEQFELIFIDDHSSDASSSIITHWAVSHPAIIVKLIMNTQQGKGKKHCINTGVQQANTHWILCIDADVSFSKDFLFAWKHTILKLPERKVFVPGLIFPRKVKNNFTEAFADVEQIMLTGFTLCTAKGGKPVLSSGANMLFRKDWFLKANPFEGNLHVPSGDDMFMLQAALPEGAGYNNDPRCFALTPSPNNWTHYFKQRRRWFGKVKLLKIRGLQSLGITSLLILWIPWINLLFLERSGISLVLTMVIWTLPFLANITFYYQVTLLKDDTQNFFKLALIHLLYPFVLLRVIFNK